MTDDSVKTDIISKAKKENVKFIRLQFVDIFGTAKNCAVTTDRLEEVLDEGLWFDGSSVEGFVRIHESDMIVMPDPSTFAVLPWDINGKKIGRFICDVQTPEGKPFEGDPRYVLKLALEEAKKMGFEYYVGPELEFHLFKMENGVTTKAEPGDGASYFDLDHLDTGAIVRKEAMMTLDDMGITGECSHHENDAGHHEIDLKYSDALTMADTVVTYKYVLKSIASKYELHASFIPKPIAGKAGNGMHTHQSLWKKGKNTFYDAKDDYNLSKTARYFIGGQLKRARGFAAITNPIVNSYKRLGAHEAPVHICWARLNRSALIRIPAIRPGRKDSARAELRNPDPSCNPYLAFAVILRAGLEGIKKKIEPPNPVEENVYQFNDNKLAKFYVNSLPRSLHNAITELDKDYLVREALGNFVYNKFREAKLKEWDSYRAHITQWELETYLPTV
jgi:glutamine synthetase